MDIHVTQGGIDPAWDKFLCSLQAGRHEQSSPYGQLKAMLGWQPIRVIVKEGQTIVGGAQILARGLPVWGQVGYISKGPVVAEGREDVMTYLYTQLGKVATKYRIILLNVQPPVGDPLYIQPLHKAGFQPSDYFVVPPDTILIDLRPPTNEILAQMKQKTRYNIGLASRKGVVVREGGEEDIATFYQWKKLTGDRKNFPYYSPEYYREAWRLFTPHGRSKLWLAYYGDEPLATLITIAFGYTTIYKWGSISGTHQELKANYLIHWTAMLWAKQVGCSYYDMGGILPEEAAAFAQEGKLPEDRSGVARFKLNFGGQLVKTPPAFENYYILRPKWLVRRTANYVWKKRTLRNLVRGIRLHRTDHSEESQ